MSTMMGPATNLYSSNAPKRPPQQMQPYGAPPNPQQQRPTFGQMQQNGQPRPAPPQNWYNYRPGSTQTPPMGAQPYQGNTTWRPQPTPGTAPQTPQAPTTTPASPVTQGSRMPTNVPGYTTDQGYAPPVNPATLQWNGGQQGPPAQPPGGYSTQPPPQYGATPAASSQQQNTANQLGNATQQLLLNQLSSPNPYSIPAVQTQMQGAQTQINEQMQQQMDAINSNLASRGVYDSSLAGGYLRDLSTGAGRQLTNVATQLLPQMASQYEGGINSALANALGYGNQQFNQQATTAEINNAQNAQQNQYLQQLLSLTQQ